jgi:hypothetical protein
MSEAQETLTYAFAAHFPASQAERMANVALSALETAGYRIVKQEQVGWGGRFVHDTEPSWYAMVPMEEGEISGLEHVFHGDRLWRDLP